MFFLSDMLNKRLHLPKPAEALPGRAKKMATAARHHVSKRALKGPLPDGFAKALFALGGFWATERLFWQLDGVWVTASGYTGGMTPNPTYQETRTGLAGHAETVLVVFDPAVVSYGELLKLFWESHDPTQGMRQGSDVGTLYRSLILTLGDAQHEAAVASRDVYGASLREAGFGKITTEISPAPDFYFAEAEQQQYLSKNPHAHCSLKGTGVAFVVS